MYNPLSEVNIGINYNAPGPSSRALTFQNHMYNTKPWTPVLNGVWNTGTLTLDTDGWVTTLPANTKAVKEILKMSDPSYKPGLYHVLWEGSGSLSFFNCTVVDNTDQHYVLDIPLQTTGVSIQLTATTPGNHIKNIRFIHEDDLLTWETDVFDPVFVERAAPFSVFRCVGWMRPKGNPQVDWIDRPTMNSDSWFEKGMAVEAIVQWANDTGQIPWFCLPMMATDDYFTQFATYVYNNLDPNLICIVELSNEVWNSIMPQHNDALQMANAEPLITSTTNPDKRADLYSYRMVKLFQTFDTVFGADKDRVIGAVGGFISGTWWAERILKYKWSTTPLTHAEAGVDAIAVAPYFGIPKITEYEVEVRKWIDDPNIDEFTYLFEELEHGGHLPASILRNWHSPNGWLTDVLDEVKVAKTQADSHGLSLIGYEGIQHLDANDSSIDLDLYMPAQHDVRMKHMHDIYFPQWGANGGSLLCMFNFIAHDTTAGSWGLLTSQNTVSSPKYDAVKEFMATLAQAPDPVAPTTPPSLRITPLNAFIPEGDAGSTPFTFTVTRVGDLTGTTTVDWTVQPTGTHPALATDFVGGAYPTGTVTFLADEDSKVITVNVQGDVVAENNKTFFVTLSNPSGTATISLASAGAYIIDDDIETVVDPNPTQDSTFSIEGLDANKSEGDSGITNFTFTITRTGNTAAFHDVYWEVAGSGGSPANANDFVGGLLPSGTVTFTPGDTSKVISVPVQGDEDDEPEERFVVQLVSVTNNGVIGSQSVATGIIANDDVVIAVDPEDPGDPSFYTLTFVQKTFSNPDERIYRNAWDMLNPSYPLMLGIGRTTAWEDENNPPRFNPTVDGLEELVCFIPVTRRLGTKLAETLTINNIVNDNLTFSPVFTPILSTLRNQDIRQVALETDVNHNLLDVATFRSVGIYRYVEFLNGVSESKSIYLPSEIDAYLIYGQNIKPVTVTPDLVQTVRIVVNA